MSVRRATLNQAGSARAEGTAPTAGPTEDDQPADRALTLYGRQPERDRINRLLRLVRRELSDAIVLTGEAGIGKSTLLDYAAQRAAGMVVLRAAGVESESRLPFAGLHALLRPVFADIDRLPKVHRTALRGALGLSRSAGENRFLISGALVALLSMLADERPVLCLVDDVQWVDAESVDALGFAHRRLETDRVGMIFAVRALERGETARPTALSTFDEVPLEPLDDDAVERFLDDRPDLALDQRLREVVATVSAGNPLALTELSADSDGCNAGRMPGVSLSHRLERAYLRKTETLSRSARRLLLMAAAEESGQLGVILSAARMVGTDMSELASLEQRGLVRVGDDRVEFAHPLVRSAVYQAATFEERQRAHLSLASALPEHDLSRRTWHQAAAAIYPDETVSVALEDLAGSAKRRAALDTAVAALERAATLTASPTRRGRLLIEAAELSWERGSAAAAQRLIDRAGGVDEQSQVRSEHLRGRILVATGAVLDGYELLAGAASRVVDSDPLRAAAILADAARAASYGGDFDRVVEAGRRTAAIAESGRTPAGRLTAGVAALLGERVNAAAPLLHAAAEAAAQENDPSQCFWAGIASVYLGDVHAACSFGVRAVSAFRASGALASLAQALELLSLAELADAPLMAEADALEGLRAAEESSQIPSIAVHLTTLATVAALRGDEQRTTDFASHVFELSARHGFAYPEARATAALGLLDLGLGRPQRALDRFDQLDRSARHPGVSLAFSADLIESAARTGDTDRATAALARLEKWALSSRSVWARALLERSRAVLSTGGAAEKRYERALELEMVHGPAVSRARTQLLFGEFLRRERRRSEARRHLRAAAEAFHGFEAVPWARRAEAELRATGESVRRRSASASGHLTPQERQIAGLVATGMSSKEAAAQLFLSPRTVDYHLRKIFSKTGIASRTQLRDLDLVR